MQDAGQFPAQPQGQSTGQYSPAAVAQPIHPGSISHETGIYGNSVNDPHTARRVACRADQLTKSIQIEKLREEEAAQRRTFALVVVFLAVATSFFIFKHNPNIFDAFIDKNSNFNVDAFSNRAYKIQ